MTELLPGLWTDPAARAVVLGVLAGLAAYVPTTLGLVLLLRRQRDEYETRLLAYEAWLLTRKAPGCDGVTPREEQPTCGNK